MKWISKNSLFSLILILIIACQCPSAGNKSPTQSNPTNAGPRKAGARNAAPTNAHSSEIMPEPKIDMLSCALTDLSCVQTVAKGAGSEDFIKRCRNEYKGTLAHKLCKMEQAFGKCVIDEKSHIEEYIHYKGKTVHEHVVSASCRLARGSWEPVSLAQQALDETKLYYEKRFETQNGLTEFEKKANNLTQKVFDGVKNQSQWKAKQSKNWFDESKFAIHREIWQELGNKGGGCGTLSTHLCSEVLKVDTTVPEINKFYFAETGTTAEERQHFFIKKGFCPLHLALGRGCDNYERMKQIKDNGCAIEITMRKGGKGHVEFLDGVGTVAVEGIKICWGVTNSWGDAATIEGGSGNFYHSHFEHYQGASKAFYTAICPCAPENMQTVKEVLKESNKNPDVKLVSNWETTLSALRFLSRMSSIEFLRKEVREVNLDLSFVEEALQEAFHTHNQEDIALLVASGGVVRDLTRWAVDGDATSVIKALIAVGADFNKQDGMGETAFFAACRKERVEVVELLIKAGADVNQKNEHGDSCLDDAIFKKNYWFFKTLVLLGAKLKNPKRLDWVFIINLLRENDTEVVKALIAQGVDPNAQSKDVYENNTMIFVAAKKNYPEIAKVLIAAGAKLNADFLNYESPIYVATTWNNVEIVKILIDAGADLKKTYYGRTILQIAENKKNTEIVKLLKDAMEKQNLIKK